ncbi:hydrolase, NUDIX family [Mycoplasmopsis alligatoris A21JP2]|uniref:Hydrolase, NUDIX family n=2 Tax=Mycoplasmopsis alligatoris TaxID=47687 RepID=D4XVM6_9BACT|nr:hydrolase, NUDIX family [Mycoplasmopsis alligatoris A21JP2]
MYESKHGFIYCQRKGINSIAALVYKKIKNQTYFLVRYQPLPEIADKKSDFEPYPCAITGTIEPNQTPLECALKEVFEEASIVVTKNNLVTQNKYIATTQSNETVFNFLLEVDSDTEQSNQNCDNSIFELNSFNKWITLEDLQKIVKNELHHSSLAELLLMYLLNCK